MSTAADLIALWDEYKASGPWTFQPTMTDFVAFLREHEGQSTEQEVKLSRTAPHFEPWHDRDGNLVMNGLEPEVNRRDEFEAPFAQGLARDTLTKLQKTDIKQLHDIGYSAARIRQMLRLNVTLNAIYSVTDKK